MKPYNPDSPTLADCDTVWLKRRGDAAPTKFAVRESRPHKRIFLVSLEGIDSLTALEPWFKSEVSVERSSVPAPNEGELYHFEAIGLEVTTVDGDVVGRIREVMPLPANDVWVVETKEDGKPSREVLIPVVSDIVKEVDLKEGTARIDPPRGLLDEDEQA